MRIGPHLLLCLSLTLLASLAAQAEDKHPEPKSFTLIAAGPADAETALAAEMVSLLPNEARNRVSVARGDAGFNNIIQLLSDPKTGAAFVSTDALAYAKDANLGGNLQERLALVARLAPQEVHVVARRNIARLGDLAGQKVGVGPSGSSSAVTAASVFAALNIAVDPVALDTERAMAMLKRGEIAALVSVGGKPLSFMAALQADAADLHLLAIPFSPALQNSYLPARFEHSDYPGLVESEVEVPTIATGLLLLASRDRDGPAYGAWLQFFIESFFSGFGTLEKRDRHPKWREVNLAAAYPGFARAEPADAWLHKEPVALQDAAEKGPDANLATTAPALPASVSMSEDQKKALFQEFIEWRRARQH
ncbi:MAG: TAXI family TRAP transporter solute-binding subunit [Methyloceanibacter sp.]